VEKKRSYRDDFGAFTSLEYRGRSSRHGVVDLSSPDSPSFHTNTSFAFASCEDVGEVGGEAHVRVTWSLDRCVVPDFARRHRLVILPRGSCPRTEEDEASSDTERAHVDRVGDEKTTPSSGMQLPLPGAGSAAAGWSDVLSLLDAEVAQLPDGSCVVHTTATWSSPLHLYERMRVRFEHDPGVVSAEHNRQIIAEKEKRGWLFPVRFPDSGAYTLYDQIRVDNYNARTGQVLQREKPVFPHGWLGIAHVCHECFSWRATSILIEEEVCRPHWNSLPQFCYRRHQRTETSEDLWNATYVQPLLTSMRFRVPAPKVSKIVPLFTLPLGITIYGAFEIQTLLDGRRSLPLTLRHYGSYEYKVRRYVSLFRYSTGPSAPTNRVSVIRKEEFVRSSDIDSELAVPNRVSFREKQHRLWFGTQATLCIFIGPPGMHLPSVTSLVSLRLLPVCVGLRLTYLGIVMSPPGGTSSSCSPSSHTVRLYSSITPFVSFGVLNVKIGRFVFVLAQEVGLPYATSMESPLAASHLWTTICPGDNGNGGSPNYRDWESFRAPAARTVSGRYAKREIEAMPGVASEGSQCPSLSSCGDCLQDAECSWCESVGRCMALATPEAPAACPDESFSFLGLCDRAGTVVLVGITTPAGGDDPPAIRHGESVTLSWDPSLIVPQDIVFLSLRAVQLDGGRAFHAGGLPTIPVGNTGSYTFNFDTAGLVTSDSQVVYEILVSSVASVDDYLTSATFFLGRDAEGDALVGPGDVRFTSMWSSCSRVCGPDGVQTRASVCRRAATGEDVASAEQCSIPVPADLDEGALEGRGGSVRPCSPDPPPCVETPLSFYEEPAGDEVVDYVLSGGRLYDDVVVEYLDPSCGAWHFLARATIEPLAEVTGSFDASPSVYLPAQSLIAAGLRTSHTALRAVLVTSPDNRVATHPFTFSLPQVEVEPVTSWEIAVLDSTGAQIALDQLVGATVRVFGPAAIAEAVDSGVGEGEGDGGVLPSPSVAFDVPTGATGTLSLASAVDAKTMLYPDAAVVEVATESAAPTTAAWLVLRANGLRGDPRNLRIALSTPPTVQAPADATVSDLVVLTYGGLCASVNGAWTCDAAAAVSQEDGGATGVCVFDVAAGEESDGTSLSLAPVYLALPFTNAETTEGGYEGGFRENAPDTQSSSTVSVAVAVTLGLLALCCFCLSAIGVGFIVLRATMSKRASATQRHRHRRATSTNPATRRHTDATRSHSSGHFSPVLQRETSSAAFAPSLLREGSMGTISPKHFREGSPPLRTSGKILAADAASSRKGSADVSEGGSRRHARSTASEGGSRRSLHHTGA
jgi:hypothetical protein